MSLSCYKLENGTAISLHSTCDRHRELTYFLDWFRIVGLKVHLYPIRSWFTRWVLYRKLFVSRLPVVHHCYLKSLYGSSELRKDLKKVFLAGIYAREMKRFLSLLFGLARVVYGAGNRYAAGKWGIAACSFSDVRDDLLLWLGGALMLLTVHGRKLMTFGFNENIIFGQSGSLRNRERRRSSAVGQRVHDKDGWQPT